MNGWSESLDLVVQAHCQSPSRNYRVQNNFTTPRTLCQFTASPIATPAHTRNCRSSPREPTTTYLGLPSNRSNLLQPARTSIFAPHAVSQRSDNDSSLAREPSTSAGASILILVTMVMVGSRI